MATRPTHASKQGTEANARPKSTEIFERGKKILVGGVDSPVRAFRAVGGTPLVIERAEGARLYDVDGREYIDYVCSWGALILGHAHPDVVRGCRGAGEARDELRDDVAARDRAGGADCEGAAVH